MQLYAGTSGYSYKEWKGSFYPAKLPAARMLEHYAGRLPAVEINNTFYRMPGAAMLEGWRAQVPEGFRFAVKASRRITHLKRLRDVGDELAFLLGNLEALGDRLGVVLFQLPPNLKADVERLDAFLARLPDGVPAAFEFRHPSWHDDAAVLGRLGERNLPVCISDVDDADAPPMVATADWGYLRLRRAGYDDAALGDWLDAVGAQRWQRAFVFFKHEDEGTGPRLAARFLELHGGNGPA